jgi:hypothetical protein
MPQDDAKRIDAHLPLPLSSLLQPGDQPLFSPVRTYGLFGFRPRHLGPLTIPNAHDSASRSRSSASFLLRSALASSVSSPCLYCGCSTPRLTVPAFRAPCMRQTLPEPPQQTTAGFLHLAPECLARAVHCLTVSPTPGSGMSVSLHYTWQKAAATGANFNWRLP